MLVNGEDVRYCLEIYVPVAARRLQTPGANVHVDSVCDHAPCQSIILVVHEYNLRLCDKQHATTTAKKNSSVLFTLSASSGKRNASVWRPSVRLSHLFQTSIERAVHTHRDSPGDSTRRRHRTFPSEYYKHGHTCYFTNIFDYVKIVA